MSFFPSQQEQGRGEVRPVMAVNGSEESADGLEFKLKILQRSGESLSLWLDQCEESVGVHIPLEDFMEADPNHLMQLALHYKVLYVLQRVCVYIAIAIHYSCKRVSLYVCGGSLMCMHACWYP